MSETINQLISSILQLLFFTLIPYVFFLFRKEGKSGFFKYIGLYKSSIKSINCALLAAFLVFLGGIALFFVDERVKQALLSPKSVTGRLHILGLSTDSFIALLLIAWIKTSLSEEILFRGFIANQLIIKLGFKIGNFLQALIFGAAHSLLFRIITNASPIILIVIFIFSTAAGWLIGYIKQEYANGSIIPGWIAHGLGNTLSYFILAYIV